MQHYRHQHRPNNRMNRETARDSHTPLDGTALVTFRLNGLVLPIKTLAKCKVDTHAKMHVCLNDGLSASSSSFWLLSRWIKCRCWMGVVVQGGRDQKMMMRNESGSKRDCLGVGIIHFLLYTFRHMVGCKKNGKKGKQKITNSRRRERTEKRTHRVVS